MIVLAPEALYGFPVCGLCGQTADPSIWIKNQPTPICEDCDEKREKTETKRESGKYEQIPKMDL